MIGVCALALYGISEIALLGGAAVVGALLPLRTRTMATIGVALAGVPLVAATVHAPASLESLGAYFLEVGAVLYGGGYVLVAFLQGLVDHQGWLTQRQLFDAVAAGQVTPGPVLTTATFVGYLVLGPMGAVVATAAIFLPAFVFTAALGPLTPWLRRSGVVRRAVRLVSVASVAIIVAVTLTLAGKVVTGPLALIPVMASSLVAVPAAAVRAS